MEIHKSNRLVKFLKNIIIEIMTKLISWNVSAKTIMYLGTVKNPFEKRIFNKIDPTKDEWGYIEIFGNLWVYNIN